MSRGPNRALETAMAEAGATNKGLARRVHDLSQRDGNPVLADHSSVRRWLAGTAPRPHAAQYVALVLSQQLGRVVTPAQLGFAASVATPSRVADVPAAYPSDPATSITALDNLATADADNASATSLVEWDATAVPHLVTSYLFGATSGESGATADGCVAPSASALRMTTASLMELDLQLGGEYVRDLALFFFRNQVMPMIRAATGVLDRRDVLAASAECAQLLGWSAYDAGRHGAAQRYFIHGLRLARAGNDPVLGSRLLGNLSHQANYIGRYSDAVGLARAAQCAARDTATPTVQAMLHAMEARALASLGEAKDCSVALARAESSFSRGRPGSDPPWINYFDQYELAGEAAHCYRDLRRGSDVRTHTALAVMPVTTPARTRAFIGLVDAMGALHCNEPHEAVSVATRAIKQAGVLQSRRYRRYVTDFREALSAAHPHEQITADFSDLVDQMSRGQAA